MSARLPYDLSTRYAAYLPLARRVEASVDASACKSRRAAYRLYVAAMLAAKPEDEKAALRAMCIVVTGDTMACGAPYKDWHAAVKAMKMEAAHG